MKLEDYFDFLGPDDIRLKVIASALTMCCGTTWTDIRQEMAAHLPTLSLEEIHATITYYLRNRAQVDAYLARLATRREERYRKWAADPSPVVQRLRAIKEQRAEEYKTPA